jgi:hypothetical protein
MAIFTDQNNNFSIYECPKVGGSTLRTWISYAGTEYKNLNYFVEYKDNGYISESTLTYNSIEEFGYDFSLFKEVEGEKICIKRDPVERFISCYTDKIIREKNITEALNGSEVNYEYIDHFLDNFYGILETHEKIHYSQRDSGVKYLWYHFIPQTFHYGNDISYYDYVFDVSEINTSLKTYLESKWKIELPLIHCRNQKDSKITLTEEQKEKVKNIYKEDYENGWK